ncbi:fumarylacetoacetate hydrolase family protein [Sodalis-like endosymbiont of Proechinophthirus fluctus]|uniref:fumarylacetoacetate hydrolase family protein n=1 Tax=Sodalis-like endosymbiont of Proechinophthirus fluctus TaxID=1462730 RepID=UPI00093DDA4F
MIFDIPTLTKTICKNIKLLPGYIIATGTPSSVLLGFFPLKYLSLCDKVVVAIAEIGELYNSII